jgi:hypothetical protein
MNRELALKVANAVLYEGYMLYPYRPSAIKNRQRWSFGILYPPAYEEVSRGTERSVMHSEVLVKVNGTASIHVQLRFLHLESKQVAEIVGGADEPVASLVVDGRMIESWDEGVERSIEFDCDASSCAPVQFSFPAGFQSEPLRDNAGHTVGTLSRTQHEITGTVSIAFQPIGDGVLKLIVDVTNTTLTEAQDRNSALLCSLVSAHTILTVNGGEFVSLLDRPEELREAVRACDNVGNFPVLVGNEGERDMMLCSPIVLYDYPQIAPESAGDFYDATEMDEMLTLRVMTLTDDEKDEMRLADDRARNLLERTQASARDQLMRTHGIIRSMRPVSDK